MTSDDRDVPALDRLRAFDPDPGPAPSGRQPSGRPPAGGSPGGQLAASIVFPGIATIRRVPFYGLLLFVLGVAAPIVFAAWVVTRRDDLVGLALDPQFLMLVAGVGLVVVLVRLLAIAEVARAFRRRRGIGVRTTLATLLTLGMSLPVLLVAYRAYDIRSAVGAAFDSGDGPPLHEAPQAGVDPADIDNVLLFGGDSGPGRWGMRTDTMILVTVHRPSGRTALVSIPRNLQRLHFPPGTPMADRFPDGFDDLANAVFTYVTGRPELMEYYGSGGLQGEAVALSQGLGYSLDVTIDDYMLVNMQGFADIVDAVGGVTIDLAERVSLPPSIPGERPLPSSIGPGPVEMDGAMAIAYARTRQDDSDYQRMGRQRQLLAALGAQVSATDAVAGMGAMGGALDDSLRTSLSGGQFSGLLDRLGGDGVGESVGLIPPLIEPGNPDWARIREIVDAVERYVATGEPSGFAA